MKKAMIFLTVFSLFFTLLSISAHAEGNTVDIGLFYGSSAKSSVKISYNETDITVTADEVSEEVEYGREKILDEEGNEVETDSVVSVDGKKYRGSIILRKNSDGMLTVINRVDIEDYIASVTAIEMSPSFNLEALKAQAVCARTYAMKNMGKHKKYGFDLCASTDCQAYKGVSAESETTNVAAQETAGRIMTYDGEVIDAVYSATSGGWTEDVKNVWGSDIPYLAAAEDKYESKDVFGNTWVKEISVEKATEIMNDKEYDLGTVTDIVVEEQTERGVVTKLKVVGTKDEKVFKRESCRLAFGSVVLSQAFSVTPVYDVDETRPKLYAYGGQTISGKISVLSADGVSERLMDTVNLLGDKPKNFTDKQTLPATGFVFEGRGYGHLVGLSQNGANGMAEAGFTYDEILKHYYKGIELN